MIEQKKKTTLPDIRPFLVNLDSAQSKTPEPLLHSSSNQNIFNAPKSKECSTYCDSSKLSVDSKLKENIDVRRVDVHSTHVKITNEQKVQERKDAQFKPSFMVDDFLKIVSDLGMEKKFDHFLINCLILH